MNLKEEIANIIAEEIKNHKCDWDKFKTFLKYSILSNGHAVLPLTDITYLKEGIYASFTDIGGYIDSLPLKEVKYIVNQEGLEMEVNNGRVEIFVGDFTYDKPNRIEKQVYGTYTDMDLNTTILKD